MVSSAPVGGGFGRRRWILNAQVAPGYGRTDLAAHAGRVGRAGGPAGRPGIDGTVLFTAARRSTTVQTAEVDGGVRVDATVGVRVPVWAAA